MKKNLFIGIDFSKATFDVSVIHGDDLETVVHKQFENLQTGYAEMLEWVKKQTKIPETDWLFCGENTGLYSLLLSEFLTKEELLMWLENPMQIKFSKGVTREKNDKIDSRDISLYAARFQDKVRAYQVLDEDLRALELLFSYRDRLVSMKVMQQVSSQELGRVLHENKTASYICERSQRSIEGLEKEIKEVEEEMKQVIYANEKLNETFAILTSIIGIGLINAVVLIVATRDFTRFDSSRKFATYIGLAPFGKDSGTCLKRPPHVSPLANKKIKALLTQAALSAVRFDEKVQYYYQRKIAEGKHKGVALNNVKNKLVHLMFALVNSKEFYQKNYVRPKTNDFC
jgi:transposase